MPIRPYRPADGPALAELSRHCARGESDFVLNPNWESVEELTAEFERFGIAPEEHLLVADSGGDDGEVQGLVGFLRHLGERDAGMLCPIVAPGERGRGVGGELLRAALQLGKQLGLHDVAAGIGTRNRAGFSLLTSHGFRPVRQAWLMRCDATPEGAGTALEGLEMAEAAGGDAGAILELYRGCGFPERSEEAMREALSDGRHRHSVARRDGRLVGFVELETHWRQRPWVAYVGVEPGMRDRGVGTALVAWALAREFEKGARAGQLMLSPANRSALRAYEKVGFRRFRLVDALERRL